MVFLFNEQKLIAKSDSFIYKGEYHTLKGINLTISKKKYFVDNETNEEYSECNDNILEGRLFKLKIKYTIDQGWNTIETVNTREEAEDFISKATAEVK